jgi:hypothetical protein
MESLYAYVYDGVLGYTYVMGSPYAHPCNGGQQSEYVHCVSAIAYRLEGYHNTMFHQAT